MTSILNGSSAAYMDTGIMKMQWKLIGYGFTVTPTLRFITPNND